MTELSGRFDGESMITPDLVQSALFADGAGPITGNAVERLTEILDQAMDGLRDRGGCPEMMQTMIVGLASLRNDTLLDGQWQSLVPLALDHPISTLLHQDPFTHWSFRKPRGYSGDAGLLDFIYGHPDIATHVDATSDLGRALFAYTSASAAAVAVRERRDILASLVAKTCDGRKGDARILTIAAGHLREAEPSRCLDPQKLKTWIALDQDDQSVTAMRQRLKGTPVTPINGSVRDILRGTHEFNAYDLVYAAGLYDYLTRDVAIKLTRRCVEHLRPGGTYLFANFAKDIPDAGYMETFMNWTLILRDEIDMQDILQACLPAGYIGEVFAGVHGNILYGTITRA